MGLFFYHLKLRCFVVVDLKMEPFEPEHAGRMNFYLTAVDERMRHPDDKASIGLLLCRDNDKLVVEYVVLRDVPKPIAVWPNGGRDWWPPCRRACAVPCRV